MNGGLNGEKEPALGEARADSLRLEQGAARGAGVPCIRQGTGPVSLRGYGQEFAVYPNCGTDLRD